MATFYALIPNVTDSARIPKLPEPLLRSALITLNLTLKADTQEKIANQNIQLTQQLAIAQAKARANYFVLALSVPDAEEEHELIGEQEAIVIVTHQYKRLHLKYKRKDFAEVVVKPVYYQITGQVVADGNIHCPWQDNKKLTVKALAISNKAQQPIGKKKPVSSFSGVDIFVIASLWLALLGAVAISLTPHLVMLLALSKAAELGLIMASMLCLLPGSLGFIAFKEITCAKKNLVIGLANAVGLSLLAGGLIATSVLLPAPWLASGVILGLSAGIFMLPYTLLAVAVYATKLYQLNQTTDNKPTLVHEPVSTVTFNGPHNYLEKNAIAYPDQPAAPIKKALVTAVSKLQINIR